MEAVTKRGDNMGKCTQKEKIDGWEGSLQTAVNCELTAVYRDVGK